MRNLPVLSLLAGLALCWALALAKVVVVESSRGMAAQLDRVRSEWVESHIVQDQVELAYYAMLSPAGLERALQRLDLRLPGPQQLVRLETLPAPASPSSPAPLAPLAPGERP